MIHPVTIPIARPLIGDEEKRAVLEVLDSGILAQGPRVAAFEAAFAEMCGVRYAIATNSGTAALQLALSFKKYPSPSPVEIYLPAKVNSPSTVISSAKA